MKDSESISAQFSQALEAIPCESAAIAISVGQPKEKRFTPPESTPSDLMRADMDQIALRVTRRHCAQSDAGRLEGPRFALPPIQRIPTMIASGEIDENRAPAGFDSLDDRITEKDLPIISVSNDNHIDA